MSITLIIISVILLIVAVGFGFVMAGLGAVKKMVINEVDLARVADGTYTGRFHQNRWNYEVAVTVKDHHISSIVTRNKTSSDGSSKFVEKAADAMVAKQSIDIDVVSGATADTRAFQKAVENALTEGTGQ